MAKQFSTPTPRLIRLPEILARTALSRSAVYRRIAAGTFPKQISIGPKSSAWLESEIDHWIATQVAGRKECAK